MAIKFSFVSGVGCPLLLGDFSVLHNDPAASQDHCGIDAG